MLSKKAFFGVFTRVEIAVISDKLIFSFVRSTHFVLVCFVLFCFCFFLLVQVARSRLGSYLAIFYICLCVLTCVCEL